ncbi:MAG: FecR domain-containing protein [Polyangiaceae bacterium]
MSSDGDDTTALPSCAVDLKDAKEWTTEERHQTVVLHPGTTITLAPHTRVLRLPMIPTALGGREFAKAAYNVELVAGRIDVEINPTRRPIYGLIVRTTRKVGAIVKYGRATVSANDGNVTVAARSGKEMMTAIGERWRPLRVGRAFVVNDASPEGLSRALLSAPSGKVDQAVAVAIGANMTPQRLSWNEIPQSKGYIVQVFKKAGNIATLVNESRVDATSQLLQRLEAGRYYATVATLDESNLESSPSPAIAFRVVEAVLPPGATVEGAVIQLPMAERLQLLEVADLELSYAKHGEDFVAAPPSIGLHDGGPVRIRLRERGSAHETHLALEPVDVVPTNRTRPATGAMARSPGYHRNRHAPPRRFARRGGTILSRDGHGEQRTRQRRLAENARPHELSPRQANATWPLDRARRDSRCTRPRGRQRLPRGGRGAYEFETRCQRAVMG